MKINIKQIESLIVFLFGVFCLTSCKKYLDAKPDQSLQIPSTLVDLQSLLDNRVYVAGRDVTNLDSFSDDYFLSDDIFQLFPIDAQNMYIWSHQNVFSQYDQTGGNDWSFAYDHIYIANTVLENIEKINVNNTDIQTYQNIKGQAYYLRAWSLLEAAWIWCQAYDSVTANQDLGLPLRLSTNFNDPSIRSTLQGTYMQIISDAKNAASLLPQTPVSTVRSSKPSAFAILARTYLSMRNYDLAGKYADSSLLLKSDLMNYNTLDSTQSYPFARFNVEVLKDGSRGLSYCTYPDYANIDTTLYKQYDPNDLRKTLFFKPSGTGYFIFRGDYNGSIFWAGIATDEMYLTRSECYARTGATDLAIQDLNKLLITRWRTGTYKNIQSMPADQLLNLILKERRKELVMRGLRWMDIKRLNKEGANITLTRNLNGQIYTLPPNDPRFALPIPEDVIDLSGMQQNP